MKKIIGIFLCFISLSVFAQDGIKFKENLKFSEILALAKKENKLIFVDAFADWCGPCKLMAKNIFTQKSVGDYYNANFINAKIDMEKGEGTEIARKYMVRSYPTYLFLNSNGELVSQNLGYMNAEDFVSIGKSANNPNNKKGSIKDRFAQGEADPEFLFNIIKTNAYTDYDFAKQASERYFQNKKTPGFTQEELSMLLFFIKSPNDGNYKVFTERKSELEKLLPENVYQQFDSQIKLADVIEKSINKEKNIINDEYFMKEATVLVGTVEAEKSLNRLKLNFYSAVGNFPEFEKAVLVYYKNIDDFEGAELSKVSKIIADYSTNSAAINKALEMAQKSVMKGETNENTLTLAKLYLKSGDKKNAKTFAEFSRDISKNQQKPTEEAEQFLQNLK